MVEADQGDEIYEFASRLGAYLKEKHDAKWVLREDVKNWLDGNTEVKDPDNVTVTLPRELAIWLRDHIKYEEPYANYHRSRGYIWESIKDRWVNGEWT